MQELIIMLVEGSGIAIFVYFVIRGMRKEIVALSYTVKHQNEIFDAMKKRIIETEEMAESYKRWWEELQANYDKHKTALIKAKDDCIIELEKAVEQKDEKLQARAQAELDMIAMQEATIEDLKRQTEITEQQLKKMRQRAKQLAENDPLTGIKNRLSIEREIIHRIRQEASFNLLLLDLDHFKVANDSYGHSLGDKILTELAQRIFDYSGEQCTIGRFGGDEFVVIDPSSDRAELDIFAAGLLEKIREPLLIDGHKITLSTTIGISCFPQHDIGARRLIAKADMALYAAKSLGRNCYKVWSSSDNHFNNKPHKDTSVETNIG